MRKRIQVFLRIPVDPPKGWKRRYGLYAIDWQTNDILLPGELFGNPTALLLCASFDNEALFMEGKTPLFRTEWLKTECPKSVADIEFIEGKVRADLAGHGDNIPSYNG
jgi:hypothetical protein